jgi:hypothetical protein
MDNETNNIKEYEIANENLRFAANLSVAEVTIFIAVTGGLLTALISLEDAQKQHPFAAFCLKFLGCAMSVCFWIIMESTRHVFFHFAERADKLETKLHIELWSTLEGGSKNPDIKNHIFRTFSKFSRKNVFPFRPNLWANRLICCCALIIWIIAICRGDKF